MQECDEFCQLQDEGERGAEFEVGYREKAQRFCLYCSIAAPCTSSTPTEAIGGVVFVNVDKWSHKYTVSAFVATSFTSSSSSSTSISFTLLSATTSPSTALVYSWIPPSGYTLFAIWPATAASTFEVTSSGTSAKC